MKHLLLLSGIISAIAFPTWSYAQTDNQNYIEVHGTAEQTVSPDKITLSITINENDYRKRSLDGMEKDMKSALKGIGIDVSTSLKVENLSSSFSGGRTNNPNAVLSKRYSLVVSHAKAASDAYFIGNLFGKSLYTKVIYHYCIRLAFQQFRKLCEIVFQQNIAHNYT